MALVPDDDIPQVQAEPIPGRGIPRISDDSSPAEFGYGVGRALEQTGVRLADEQKREAKAAADKAQREADAVRVAQANTALSGWVTNQLYTADDAAYKQHGVNAIGMDGKYLPKFGEQVQQIRADLTPDQQAMFDVHAAEAGANMNLGLARYEKEEGDRTAQTTYEATFKQQITDASLDWRGMSDAKTYQGRKDNILTTAEAAATRLNLNKQETQGAQVDAMISATTRNALADGSIAMPTRFLEDHKDELTNPALYATLKNEIDAKAKQHEAELKDGLADKWQDAYKGGLAGIPGSPNLISNGELKILFPHDWQQKRDLLNKAGVAGASEKQFDQMDSAGIQAHLDKINPTKGTAQYGQAQDIDLFNMEVAAAGRSLARRQADPRGFAISNYGDQPIDWSQPITKAADVINSRQATAADDSRRLGVSMTVLSKPEATQLSSALASAPPDRQLNMMVQMREALGNESTFRAVVEQVRPSDPVIAEAALRVPRNPNTAPMWYDPKFDNDPGVSRQILAGNDLLNPKGSLKAEEGKGGIPKGVAMPTEAQLRLAFNSHFPTDEIFRGNPIAANDTYAAFRSLYAARVALSGDTSGNVVNDAVRYAAKALAPHTDSHFAGTAVAVPAGMDPATFPDRVNDAVAASLKAHGSDPKLFKGHGIMLEGRLGSGDYVVLGADNTNAATYPGTNIPVRIHLDQQYARPGAKLTQRPSTRAFPARPMDSSVPIGPDYNADIPNDGIPPVNPADYVPAG